MDSTGELKHTLRAEGLGWPRKKARKTTSATSVDTSEVQFSETDAGIIDLIAEAEAIANAPGIGAALAA